MQPRLPSTASRALHWRQQSEAGRLAPSTALVQITRDAREFGRARRQDPLSRVFHQGRQLTKECLESAEGLGGKGFPRSSSVSPVAQASDATNRAQPFLPRTLRLSPASTLPRSGFGVYSQARELPLSKGGRGRRTPAILRVAPCSCRAFTHPTHTVSSQTKRRGRGEPGCKMSSLPKEARGLSRVFRTGMVAALPAQGGKRGFSEGRGAGPEAQIVLHRGRGGRRRSNRRPRNNGPWLDQA